MEGGVIENSDGVFSIRNVKLGILRGIRMTKLKMRIRRLDKKIKIYDDLDVVKCRGSVLNVRILVVVWLGTVEKDFFSIC